MARINIEDSLYRDDKFLKLIEKTRSRYEAVGLIVSAFSLAQKFWLRCGAVPLDEWPDEMNVLIECKLAAVQENGVYVFGSSDQFSWLTQKSNAGKSKSEKKALQIKQARLAKKSSITSERTLNGTERSTNGSEALTLTLTPTPTPTLAAVSLEQQHQHFFEKFVFEELNTLDTGIAKYASKVDRAFENEKGFDEWVSSIVGSRSYKKIETSDAKKRYFLSALKSEIKIRGVL